jgi:hypothetical protein
VAVAVAVWRWRWCVAEYVVGEKEGGVASEREREREHKYKTYEKFVPESIRTLLKHPMLPSVHAYKGRR